MDSVGVREVRQNLSTYLERVKAGESLTITEHGHPVAVLAPPPPEDAWDAMVAAGEITPAKRRLVPRDVPPRRAGELAVDAILQELREDRI